MSPPGSSLRGDTSLFGLSMLVAGLEVVVNSLEKKTTRFRIFCQVIALALIMACGMVTESRRFLVLSVLIPSVWLIRRLTATPGSDLKKSALLPIVGLVCAIGILFWAIYSPVPVETGKVLHIPGTSQGSVAVKSDTSSTAQENKPADPNLTVRKTDLGMIFRLFGTLGANQSYGLESRIEKWQLGMNLLTNHTWLLGMGFSYHEIYSCRFVDCSFIDYPHFPILSEWLVSGIAGAFVAVAIYFIYFFLFQSIWRSRREGWTSGSSAMVLAVLPYSLISGDTLFSIPQFIMVCLLAQSQVETGVHAIGKDSTR